GPKSGHTDDPISTPTQSRQGMAEQVERLAYHALRSEVWDKAVTYCQQAGARAHDRAAFREAVVSFEQALAHLPETGDIRVLAVELRLALAYPLAALGENGRCLALLGEAEALARALDDRVRLGRVLASMASVRRTMRDFDGALVAGQQALALAVELGERALQGRASLHLGQAYYAIGDFGRAAALLRHSVEAVARGAGTPRTDGGGQAAGVAGAGLEHARGFRRGPAPRERGTPPRHAGGPRADTDHCPCPPRPPVPRPRGPGACHPGVGGGPGPLSCLRRPGLGAS